MSEKSRVQIAAEAVQNWLQEEIPDAQDIQVSYAPRNALSDFPADKYALFLTPEDVSIFDKVHDKTKFTEVVTLTLSIVRKIENVENPTEEMSQNMLFLQNIRDKMRFRNAVFQPKPVQFQIVENTTSRPLYDREKLETENTFYSYFLVEAAVHDTRAR